MPFLPLLDTNFILPAVSEEAQTPWSLTTSRSPRGTVVDSQPLRTAASPRSSQPQSPVNHVAFDLRPERADTERISSGEQSPVRGRTLHRVPARDRSIYRSTTRATTRRSLNPVANETDVKSLRERLLSRDLTAEPEDYYDNTLLEPWPFERWRTRSLSTELHSAATYASSVDLDKFEGHRDTFALMGFRRLHNRAVDLDHAFWQNLSNYIDHDTYRALRLSCKNWSQAISRARPIVMPLGNLLPAEILENILGHLGPADFNAARHACRAWMIASLEEHLLIKMLQEGGWWIACQHDMANFAQNDGRKLSIASEAWLMSKRLSTECGLIPRPFSSLSSHIEGDGSSPSLRKTANGLVLTSESDFSEMSQVNNSADDDPTLQFTVSVCQKYLLLAKHQTVYVYSLSPQELEDVHTYGGQFEALSTISCPGRVLAVNMDTSSERFAVAALLEDRIGMVCDVERSHQIPEQISNAIESPLGDSHHTNIDGRADIDGPSIDVLAWTGKDSPRNNVKEPQFFHALPASQRMFRKVCSAYNPPTSVAICPQRRCVAFGNASGVELHWVDVLSGQDLQRWFPLSSASDFLYFLPNRQGIDNARKLRLIASVAHPGQKEMISYLYPNRADILAKRATWTGCSDDSDTWKTDWDVARVSSNASPLKDPDHYHARPLSDGYSVLFVDAATNLLCLGGDERPEFASSRLTRRFSFHGPSAGMLPYIYCTASELSWGVRVVAGYGRENQLEAPAEIWLFTVPPDFFLTKGKEGEIKDTFEATTKPPLKILGKFVASVSKLAALSIDASLGNLTIRAFSAQSKAYTWQLAGSRRQDIVKRAVLADGGTIAVVNDSEDEDIEMQDANSINAWESDYDGSASRTPRLPTLLAHSLDADGDLVMRDVPPVHASARLVDEDEGYQSGEGRDDQRRLLDEDEGYVLDDEVDRHSEYEQAGGAFAIHAPPIHGRWSEGDDDWVPEYLAQHMTGIEDDGLGIDLLGSTRLELEFMGNYSQTE